MAKPPSKPQQRAAAKEKALRNPLTGQAPNSFSAGTAQASGRSLPADTAVRAFTPKTKASPTGAATSAGNVKQVPDVAAASTERKRLKGLHDEATKPGGVVDAQLGYRKPEGMGDSQFAWTMGAHHMFPNVGSERNNPAINTPHQAHDSVTVQRRAEDLSGNEYRKGEAVLAHYGHDARNPTRSLRQTMQRQANRMVSEHVRAGVEESSSQLFYGGGVNTEIPQQPDLEQKHYEGATAAHGAFSSYAGTIARHPGMDEHLAGQGPRKRMHAATQMLAQAAADTSPNSKWRDPTSETQPWPNLKQAHESVTSVLENRPPKFITGRTPNEEKAAGRARTMLDTGDFSAHQYGNPASAPKTVAFRGALADRDAADSFAVADVHQASVMAPGLPTAKSQMFNDMATGRKTKIHADAPERDRKGKSQIFEYRDNKTTGKNERVPVTGYSRPEEMLDRGAPAVHALNDRAMREVATTMGISRGVNYADNTHALQAAMWGSQQVQRPDVHVSHSDQYPVVRDWGAEGHAQLNEAGQKLFGGGGPHNVGPQFVANPNTTRINKTGSQAHNPGRSKPYDV